MYEGSYNGKAPTVLCDIFLGYSTEHVVHKMIKICMPFLSFFRAWLTLGSEVTFH